MDQTQIAILSLIITTIGMIVTLLIALFPKLFPAIGIFLLSLNHYVWVIILLLLIVAGQQIFIYVN
ncbi:MULTISPECIES: hypothetical protein [Bacillus]|uniref:hypothetical protein n=1 Tax=Bacillus TaxID=1386 RepID=UPI00059CA612|nr:MULTISPECIES: hypothetical protein [Bacillus]MBO3764349.1 hypothetical protein [Bacillus subtilis]MDP8525070.1 hypothetical protein [Bacillus subtilis]ODV44896.1 hypothetical protein BCM26_04485 [Bacillus subtilis]OJH64472.1 hypothetical protein BOH71_03940 [Bacillus subtilis]QJC16447.1 hypothetical protein HGH94_11600 [Bacillus subtilis]